MLRALALLACAVATPRKGDKPKAVAPAKEAAALLPAEEAAPDRSSLMVEMDASGPSCLMQVGLNDDERLESFVVARDGHIYHSYQASPRSLEWSPWASLGSVSMVGGPVVARSAEGRLELFALGQDRVLRHKIQTSPGSPIWTSWNSVGDTPFAMSAPPSVVMSAEETLHLFARTTEGDIRHLERKSTPSSGVTLLGEWQSLGGKGWTLGRPAVCSTPRAS